MKFSTSLLLSTLAWGFSSAVVIPPTSSEDVFPTATVGVADIAIETKSIVYRLNISDHVLLPNPGILYVSGSVGVPEGGSIEITEDASSCSESFTLTSFHVRGDQSHPLFLGIWNYTTTSVDRVPTVEIKGTSLYSDPIGTNITFEGFFEDKEGKAVYTIDVEASS